MSTEGPTPDDVHRRNEPRSEYRAAVADWIRQRGTPRPSDEQLLGHPQWIQGDERIASSLASMGVVAQQASIQKGLDRGLDLRALAEAATHARLLWQLTDVHVYGLDGCFTYLMLDPDDLVAHRFERCRVIVQSD